MPYSLEVLFVGEPQAKQKNRNNNKTSGLEKFLDIGSNSKAPSQNLEPKNRDYPVIFLDLFQGRIIGGGCSDASPPRRRSRRAPIAPLIYLKCENFTVLVPYI